MTRRSILEYTEAIRGRYYKSSKKTKMLDEFVAATGLHRKAAIRLLNRQSSSVRHRRPGRPRMYSLEAMTTVKIAWEATDCLCSLDVCSRF